MSVACCLMYVFRVCTGTAVLERTPSWSSSTLATSMCFSLFLSMSSTLSFSIFSSLCSFMSSTLSPSMFLRSKKKENVEPNDKCIICQNNANLRLEIHIYLSKSKYGFSEALLDLHETFSNSEGFYVVSSLLYILI